MEIKIKRITSWEDVVDAARFTQGLEELGHEPTAAFKSSIILAEHSPLRELVYKIQIINIPYYVMAQLVRHNIGINKYVSTSRPDITGVNISRHEQRKDDLCNVQFTINAQSLLNMSRWRLCKGTVETETRLIWHSVITKLREIDPILASKCKPTCIYRGFCPEKKCCGYVKSKDFREALRKYRKEYGSDLRTEKRV